MIKAIAFDYGGVIITNESDLLTDISKYLNIDKSELIKEYNSLNYLSNIQNMSYEDLFVLIVSKFNNSKESKKHTLKLAKENYKKWHLNIELIEIIKKLKDKNYKIALLSNNVINLRKELIKNKTINLFDEIVISGEVGYQKPQPEIFDILFNKLGVAPSEVVFIDDNLKSLENVEIIGYIPILYKNIETFKNKLSEILGIKI